MYHSSVHVHFIKIFHHRHQHHQHHRRPGILFLFFSTFSDPEFGWGGGIILYILCFILKSIIQFQYFWLLFHTHMMLCLCCYIHTYFPSFLYILVFVRVHISMRETYILCINREKKKKILYEIISHIELKLLSSVELIPYNAIRYIFKPAAA